MDHILLLYASTDGHTLKICKRLMHVLEKASCRVSLHAIEDYPQVDLQSFCKIVVGASIRYGKHSRVLFNFIESQQVLLDSRPTAFFSVNIVARKAEKNRPETNPYVLKFLRQSAWRPSRVEVFAGKLDYPRYGVFDRLMIRFIMLITQGPTDPTTIIEFTDWQRVEDFAREISEM